jgi:O-antigen/teichoic acid export membrane protein
MSRRPPPAADSMDAADNGGSASDSIRSDLTRLARGGLTVMAGGLCSLLFGFAFTVVVTRGLQVERAGVLFEATALAIIAGTIAQGGADSGLMRWISRARALGHDADIRRSLPIALAPVLALGTILATALFVFAAPISHALFHGPHASAAPTYIRILAPFVPFAAASAVALAGTRGFGSMIPFVAIGSIGKPALRLALGVAFVLIGVRGAPFALAWALPIGVGCVAAVVALRWALERTESQTALGSGRKRAEIATEFWKFAAPRGMASLFQVGVLWFDVLLIGALASSREAGVYTAAARYLMLGAFVLQAVIFASGPELSAFLARGERVRAAALYRTATWWVTALSWPAYITAAVFAPVLVSVFGPGFSGGANALTVLALAMLLSMATGPVTLVLLMGGKSSWNMANAGAALAVNVVLNIVLIPPFGITGAAVAWAATIAVGNLVPLVQIWLYLGLHPLGRSFLVVSVGAAACFGGLGLAIREAFGPSPITLGAFLPLAVLAYVAVLRRFRETLSTGAFREAIRFRNQRSGSVAPDTDAGLGREVSAP